MRLLLAKIRNIVIKNRCDKLLENSLVTERLNVFLADLVTVEMTV